MEIYQVDAFCKEVFSGNPAAVCLMESWPKDELMQNIAAENHLAETAFCVRENDHYRIRWFTPSIEVDLCGHGTLATAHVLFEHKSYEDGTIVFTSRSGELSVTKNKDLLTLDFPVDDWKRIEVREEMHHWFSAKPIEAYRGKTDYLLIFSSEADIANIVADLSLLEQLKEVRGVIVSAKGDTVDFVSRFFAPQSGIPEDMVTGSAHTSLTPYWSQRLGKNELVALQLSRRKGYLYCKDEGNRIKISGKAKTFFVGRIEETNF
jgi:PhzF family phenazine biosynthesis protein